MGEGEVGVEVGGVLNVFLNLLLSWQLLSICSFMFSLTLEVAFLEIEINRKNTQ